jgi:hypothetical protein
LLTIHSMILIKKISAFSSNLSKAELSISDEDS